MAQKLEKKTRKTIFSKIKAFTYLKNSSRSRSSNSEMMYVIVLSIRGMITKE